MFSRFLTATILVLAAGAVLGRDCTREEAMAAERVAAQLSRWNDIFDTYHRYSHCDDGAIAEGFTDSIARLLASKWDSLPEMAAIADKNPGFKAFVLRHVNATADTRDLERIAESAKSKCLPQYQALCAALRAEALKR